VYHSTSTQLKAITVLMDNDMQYTVQHGDTIPCCIRHQTTFVTVARQTKIQF